MSPVHAWIPLLAALASFPAAAAGLFGNPELEVGGIVYELDTGDLDGDGVEDFAIGLRDTEAGVGGAGTDHELLVILNDGNGHTASRTFYTSGEQPRHVTMADFDGDTDLDLIVSNYSDGTLTFMANDGAGGFTDALTGATVMATVPSPRHSLYVNVIGDALPDIVVASTTTVAHENLGGGSFGAPVTLGDGYVLGQMAAADLEPDGDVDIVSVGGFVLRNNGDDTFTRVDVDTAWRTVAAGDLDGDGDPEIVAGTNQVGVYPNAAGSFGAPTFYGITASGTNPLDTLALGDVDADGDLDIAAGGRDFANDRIFLLRNDGSASFGTAEEHRVDNVPYSMKWGSYDGDAELDLAVARGYLSGGGGLIVLLGDGLGNLSSPDVEPIGGEAYGLDVGDIDDDGDPDVVAAMRAVSGVAVLANDGAGGLPVAGFLPVTNSFVAGQTSDLELVDFDGDDDLDLALDAARGYGVAVADNNGGGAFTQTQEPDGVYILLTNIETRDVDNDGDPDFTVGSRNLSGESRITIFENDGAGGFPDPPAVLAYAGSLEDLALEDIDGDGDPDAAVPYRDGDVLIHRNDGGGGFGPATPVAVPAGLSPKDVALADLDGDMRPELLVGALDAAASPAVPFADRVLVYPNDGSGNFGAPQSIEAGVGPEHFAVADFDLDGDPDVAVANVGFLDPQRGRSGNVTLLLNDGLGSLTAEGSYELGVFASSSDVFFGERLQPIDHDRDGDVDLIYADPESGDLLIFVNRIVGVELARLSVSPGGYATTDTEIDGSTLLDPIESLILSPPGGDVEIVERAISSPAPPGWLYFGQEVALTADASTPASPLLLAFRVDASRIPAGSGFSAIRAFRDGVIVPPCVAVGGEAAPDPCFQAFTPEVDGDVTLEVRSSAASVWNFGVQRPLDLGIDLSLDSPLGTEVISFAIEDWQVDLILDALDLDDDGLEEMEGTPASFELSGSSNTWGPIKLRLRDPQLSPFLSTAMNLEEDVNAKSDRLELPPYDGSGSGIATLQAYIELEIEQQQILLHNESLIPFSGSVSRWPPAPGEKLQSSLQVDLLDEQNEQTGFALLPSTTLVPDPPAGPSGSVPPPPPPIAVPALGPAALGVVAAALGLLGAGARRRSAPRRPFCEGRNRS